MKTKTRKTITNLLKRNFHIQVTIGILDRKKNKAHCFSI